MIDINSEVIFSKYSKLSRYHVLCIPFEDRNSLKFYNSSHIIQKKNPKNRTKKNPWKKMQKIHNLKMLFGGWRHPHQLMLTIYFVSLCLAGGKAWEPWLWLLISMGLFGPWQEGAHCHWIIFVVFSVCISLFDKH